MDYTFNEIMTRALGMIGISAEEETIENPTLELGKDVFNDLLAQWEGQGIYIGFSEISNVESDVILDRAVYAAVKANLAVALAPYFNKDISTPLALAASTGMATLLHLSVGEEMNAVEFPDTLPVGSGNKNNDVGGTPFYNDENANILNGQL